LEYLKSLKQPGDKEVNKAAIEKKIELPKERRPSIILTAFHRDLISVSRNGLRTLLTDQEQKRVFHGESFCLLNDLSVHLVSTAL